jgi:hypothetical protein
MTDQLLLWGRQKDAQPIIFDATRAREIRGQLWTSLPQHCAPQPVCLRSW